MGAVITGRLEGFTGRRAVFGSELHRELAAADVDEILTVEAPALGQHTAAGHVLALAALISEEQPSLVFFPHTYQTRDFAPALAARLGHPAWDPHGDPIPTAGGALPSVRRLSLAGVEPGRTAEIIHLEDEPVEIYDALPADGLGLGTRVAVVDRTDRQVRLRARGREWPMDVVVARNVTVRLLPEGTSADEYLPTLLRSVDVVRADSRTDARRLVRDGKVLGAVILLAIYRAVVGRRA